MLMKTSPLPLPPQSLAPDGARHPLQLEGSEEKDGIRGSRGYTWCLNLLGAFPKPSPPLSPCPLFSRR